MSYRKTLISIAITGLLAASGTAVANDCEERIEAFEERLDQVELNATQSDEFQQYLDSAAELAENEQYAVCQETVSNMHALLSEYTGDEVPATARAEIDDGQSWDLNDDGQTLEQEVEAEVSQAADELREAGAVAATAAAITAEELDDADVFNSSGEEIGEFEGFVRHTQSGETHVVLEVDDGWFSERDVVVSASDINLNSEGELVYTGAVDLEQADEFDSAGYERIDDQQRVTQLGR